MYKIRCEKWLRQLINQRKLLIRQNKSLKSQADVEEAIQKLEMYLGTYNYTDVNMARFMKNKADLIVTIMPGTGSTNRYKRMEEYSQLLGEGSRMIKRKDIQHELPF